MILKLDFFGFLPEWASASSPLMYCPEGQEIIQNIVKIVQNQIVIFWMILKLDFLWISARMGIRKQSFNVLS